jgi:subtilase family serine protease
MRSPRLGRRLTIAGGFLVCAAAIAATSAAGASSPAAGRAGPNRHTLPGTKPAWTAAAPQVASVPASQGVSARVWLAPRNAAQLDALAQAVTDPGSSQYAQFISEDQYRAQFAPTTDQVNAVKQWLTGAGLQVTSVGPDNHYVAVQGSASATNAAFGTQLAKFSVNGTIQQAPAVDLSVPDAVAGTVLAVTGLTTFGHATKPADFGPPPGFVNATPCSSYYGQQVASKLPRFRGKTLPFAPCGYTPEQLRGTYELNVGFGLSRVLGKGSTVAIVDAYDSPTLKSDADTYSQRRHEPTFGPGQFQDRSVPEDASTGDECGGNGWYGEQTLDVEAVHGMAPGADIRYQGAASCFDDDLLAMLTQIVHDNRASIVSNSWGEPTFVVVDGQLFITIDQGIVDSYESVFKQGAVQGIGFYFSSGDDGDDLAAWGFAHPDWPTGDPWVTSVGGTSLAVDRRNSRDFETGWGTNQWALSSDLKSWVFQTFRYGAGGGYSLIFDQPAYQNGVVKNNPTGGRAVPDIGLDADPTTGMLIGETQDFALPSSFGPAGVHYGEYRIGGTSLACPLMAGIQAVAQTRFFGPAKRVGFANPLIYSVYRHVGGAYYDVTPQGDPGNVRADFVNGYNADGGISYTVRTFDEDSSLTTGPGWDDVTGVGAPTARYIAAVALPPRFGTPPRPPGLPKPPGIAKP